MLPATLVLPSLPCGSRPGKCQPTPRPQHRHSQPALGVDDVPAPRAGLSCTSWWAQTHRVVDRSRNQRIPREPVADDAAGLSYKPFRETISRTTAASPRTRADTPSGSCHHGEVAASTPLAASKHCAHQRREPSERGTPQRSHNRPSSRRCGRCAGDCCSEGFVGEARRIIRDGLPGVRWLRDRSTTQRA